jgi:hypothetical protein
MISTYRKYFSYLNENSSDGELEYIVAPYAKHPNGQVGWKGKLVWMSPEKFLDLAKPLTYVNIDQVKNLEKKTIG